MLVTWCDSNHQVLKTKKTVEMVFHPHEVGETQPSNPSGPLPEEFIRNSRMQSYHILGVVHGFDIKLMVIFYQIVLESLIRYDITVEEELLC